MTESEEKELRQEWATPDKVFKWLDDRFGFCIDVCASEHNTKCHDYINKEMNGLKCEWGSIGHRVFCNPGFSNVTPWLKKAWSEANGRGVTSVVITHSSLTSEWFKAYSPVASWIWLPNKRINYIAPPGIKQTSNPRDTMIWVFEPHGHLTPTRLLPVTIT